MKLIVITGQTATGKTKLALDLAKKNNGELINCDSRQVYKYLDIITGKDLTDHTFHKVTTINTFDIGYYFLAATKLWLYDIIDPKQSFSSFDYKTCAINVIKNIINQEKTPIIVGGSYLYLQSLLYGFDIQVEPNWELRNSLNNKSVAELQHILQNSNSELFTALNKSDRLNPHRLIRKIEIAQANDARKAPQTIQELLNTDISVEIIGLRHTNKEQLQEIIAARVEERINQGAYKEVQTLLNKGFTSVDPGLKTIGYQQIIPYLQGNFTEETMKQDWITKELQYAKRQYTFMKKDSNIMWREIN